MTEVLIIDIQCLVGSRNEFYPKEISVLALHNNFINHYIIGPPCKYSKLEKGARRQNSWLTKNYHKIEWDRSEVPYKNLDSLIENIGELGKSIYVRGEDKRMFLQQYLREHTIINLENISPRFALLPANENYCLYHGINFPTYSCTHQNVYKI